MSCLCQCCYLQVCVCGAKYMLGYSGGQRRALQGRASNPTLFNIRSLAKREKLPGYFQNKLELRQLRISWNRDMKNKCMHACMRISIEAEESPSQKAWKVHGSWILAKLRLKWEWNFPSNLFHSQRRNVSPFPQISWNLQRKKIKYICVCGSNFAWRNAIKVWTFLVVPSPVIYISHDISSVPLSFWRRGWNYRTLSFRKQTDESRDLYDA